MLRLTCSFVTSAVLVSLLQPKTAGQAPGRMLIENLCMKAVNQSVGKEAVLKQSGPTLPDSFGPGRSGYSGLKPLGQSSSCPMESSAP